MCPLTNNCKSVVLKRSDRKKKQKVKSADWMDTFKRKLILSHFGEVVAKDSVKARKIILQLAYKNDAHLLSCIALTYKDEALFFKNGKQRIRSRNEKLI